MPPGVVDTRPFGMRMVDVHRPLTMEGVVDTRPTPQIEDVAVVDLRDGRVPDGASWRPDGWDTGGLDLTGSAEASWSTSIDELIRVTAPPTATVPHPVSAAPPVTAPQFAVQASSLFTPTVVPSPVEVESSLFTPVAGVPAVEIVPPVERAAPSAPLSRRGGPGPPPPRGGGGGARPRPRGAAGAARAAAVESVAEAPVAPVAEPGPAAPVPSPFPSADQPYARRSQLRKQQTRAEARKEQARPARRSGNALGLPQVGIASALGLATIAAPLAGALTAPVDAAPTKSVAAPAPVAAIGPVFPQLNLTPNGVEQARIFPDQSRSPVVPAALSAPSRLLVDRPSRGNERAVLPGCTGQFPAATRSSNGTLPSSILCTLWDKQFKLRADAGVAFAKLNVAYNQRFGTSICVVDAYRTFAQQQAVKQERGSFAATPGKSEHGWGLAVDLCGGSGLANTAQYTWLRANAGRYGWENPDWARPGGSGPYEPWHWEFTPGKAIGPGSDQRQP